jgi:peptide/nickel transport system substrate-binding protein
MGKLRAGALLLGAVALLAGCGGGDEGTSGGEQGRNNNAPIEGQQGGKVTFLAAADVDYLDPGQTYYTFGFMVQYAINRSLYSFKPGDAVNPVPDLAEGEPVISDDQKTITVKLRSGVNYSPPVNREVKSADVKYAIERGFTENVPNGYAYSYFSDLEGAPSKPGAYKQISGIETPDDRTIVFHLKQPTAVTTAAALVLPLTVPVPKEYAQKFDRENPSHYDQYAVATGPYMVRNNEEGKLVGRDPGKSIEIVRNPNWKKETDYRPAYLDEVTIEEGNDDLTVASRRALSGEGLMCCDSGQPPIAVLRQAITRSPDQLGRTASGGGRWISLNTTIPPFDNINVRKAIIASADRDALRLTRGGKEVGPIAQHFIPPGVAGFEESGGEKGFTDIDFMQNPKGDPELAKKYMLQAKADGLTEIDDNGRWTGGKELLTIATNADPGLQTALAFQGQIEKLGFKLNFRQVPQDTLYTRFCNVPKTKYAICPNVGWFRDFADPQSVLQPTFSGDQILQQGNSNWSMLDDPKINQAIKDAAQIPAGDERNRAFADVNKMVVEQAIGVPYSWDDSFQVASKDVQGVMNGYTTTWDLSFSFVK